MMTFLLGLWLGGIATSVLDWFLVPEARPVDKRERVELFISIAFWPVTMVLAIMDRRRGE